MAILKNYPDTTTPLTVEKLLDFCHPVGEVFFTEDTTFDPNVEWGGTWELDTDGVVYGSKSSTNGSPFNVNVGTIIGEDKHTLTINEMPSHNHRIRWEYEGSLGSGYGTLIQNENASTNYGYFTESTGGGQAHNNVQRTRICNIWRRIA